MHPVLQVHLSNVLAVSFQARLAHWNVRGSNFSGLHALFGEVYDTLTKQSDDVAERIAQLGAVVDGSVGYVAAKTTYPDSRKSADNNYLTKVIADRLKALATDGVDIFIGVVTDTQWEVFCREFGEPELAADSRLKTNTGRVGERGWLLPRLEKVFARYARPALERKLEAIGLPSGTPSARPGSPPISMPRASSRARPCR